MSSTMLYQSDFSAPLAYWPDLLQGAGVTLGLSLTGTVLGFALGVLGAVGRTGPRPVVARVCAFYVEAIRNTPLLVQIFIVYFGLASVGLKVGAFAAATAALVINVGAYTAEKVRAGIESIPKGQIEAAQCLALSR